MTFEEVVDQAVAMLQRRGRVAYRALKRQFELDDDYLDDLKATICYEYPQVVDDGQGLVWPGEIGTMPETRTTPASAAASAPRDQGREPVAYTPQHLAEKILTSRSALEGERKQVTVMFADIKDSTELIRDLDPEDAQKLLDPVIHIMMDAVHRFEGTVNQVLGDGIMAIFGEGMAVGAEAMRMAESVENPFSLIVAYASVGGLCFYQGHVDEAIAILERGLALCNATQNLFHFPWVASRLAVPYVLVGRGAEALALVKQAMERVDAESRVVHVARVVTGLSEALLLAGCPEEADTLAGRAFALSQARRERGVEAHVRRLLGDIAMHRAPLAVNQAETHYRQSLALAVELGMRPLQAHCHRTLGMLYGQTGQPEQARAELSTAIELYRDMEMTLWLPETEALLAEVGKR